MNATDKLARAIDQYGREIKLLDRIAQRTYTQEQTHYENATYA